MAAAESATVNVIGERQPFETSNYVALVPRCANEEDPLIEGNVSENIVPNFCVQEEPVDLQTQAAALKKKEMCLKTSERERNHEKEPSVYLNMRKKGWQERR